MDLDLSAEQEMLRDSAREFLQSKYPVERVAEIADGEGFDPSSWSEVAELGWTGISLSPNSGRSSASVTASTPGSAASLSFRNE